MIQTHYGAIQGLVQGNCEVFLGIPYAQAPAGPLRWHAPVPMEPWEGVLQATRLPGRCMQETHNDPFYGKEFYDELAYQTPICEDSLCLNIWCPRERDGALPVALWIHGGAFMGGYGHEKPFDGAAFCARGVILVTINYRLGPWGFLTHPWLSEESHAHSGQAISGNYGILDQMAALDWVYENISAFGGDPEQITVMGQSAGCMSVQTLISSPLTRGKICRAVLQSGLGLNYDHDLASAEALGVRFAESARVHTLQEMRRLTKEQVEAAARPLILEGFGDMKLPYTPIIDGWVLPMGYDETLQTGNVHPIPCLIGSNEDDIAVDPGALARGERGKVYDGCTHFAAAHRAPVYRYYFRRDLPGDDAGSFHSAELWYMFGTLSRCWRPMTPADYALSERMVGYWTNFIRTGDPNGDGLPTWRPCQSEADIQILDISPDGR